jgi:hypothetical protein
LRGFDEAMNKYFHSDSNLAKRMWLLNGGRTDHLLGDLWVLHQDHYLSGEWAKSFTGIMHNDLSIYVRNQNTIEANKTNWGLQGLELPFFSLSEKIKIERVSVPDLSGSINGDLPLSHEVDWRTESLYRLCHYKPEVLTLYLRETLRVASPDSRLVYMGENAATYQRIQQIWQEISPSGFPVRNLSSRANEEIVPADILLVDSFYERSEYVERRIQLVKEQMERRSSKGQINAQQANEEICDFSNNIDWEAWKNRLFPIWEDLLPSVRLQTGALVIVLGSNMGFGTFPKLQQVLSKQRSPRAAGARGWAPAMNASSNGKKNEPRRFLSRVRAKFGRSTTPERIHGVTLAHHGFHRADTGPVELSPLYIHHRLMVLRVK